MYKIQTMGIFSFLFGKKINQTQEYIDKGAVILDVRTNAEFKEFHFKNAVHIPVYRRIDSTTPATTEAA